MICCREKNVPVRGTYLCVPLFSVVSRELSRAYLCHCFLLLTSY